MIRHITAGGLGGRSMEQYIWDILVNDTAVPFKSQFSIEPGNGNIWLIGTGRANHCLNMSRAAHDALVNGTMALDQFCQNLRGAEFVGSIHTIGVEQVAAVAPDAAQSRSTDFLGAELFKLRGWSGVDTAGHGEVAIDRGPGDPNEHMGNVRKRGLSIVAGTVPPPPQEVEDMANVPQAEWDELKRKVAYMHIVLAWGFDPTKDFQGAVFGEQGEITQRLRRLGSLQEILAGVKQALIDDPDVPVDPAKLNALVDAAVEKQLQEGFDVHVSKDAVQRQLAALAEIGAGPPADDVPPRTTEAESDAYEREQG
jgi:hypothetical protein